MKILFVGDIFGRPGREAVKHFVPLLKEKEGIDVVIANGENARHGNGINMRLYDELSAAGVDWFTSGDHIWADQEFVNLMSDPGLKVLKPANFAGTPGRGMATFSVRGEDVTLINLLGRVFVGRAVDNAFLMADELIKQAKGFILVDFHAEATSEKTALGMYLDGRVGAVVGTHTHVQTADEKILPGGTAYISDVGMTGPYNSSIGVDFKQVINSYTKGYPFKLEPAEGVGQFNAVIIETDGPRAKSIKRVFEVMGRE